MVGLTVEILKSAEKAEKERLIWITIKFFLCQ